MEQEDGSIRAAVRAYILEEYVDATEDLKDETLLISSGIIDSISILQMVDFLEETFKFEFQPHEVDQSNLNTVNLIVAFVKKKLQ